MSTLAALTSSASAEHYTSAIIVERARRALGEIDLDPASSPEANRVVRAKRIFTKADDGKLQEWSGRVFVNPPSAKVNVPPNATPAQRAAASAEGALVGDVRTWWVKTIGEFAARRIDAFIFVVFRIDALTSMAAGSIERGLPLPLSQVSCWPWRRVPYWTPGAQLQLDGSPSIDMEKSPTHATCILFFAHGASPHYRFADAFQDIGSIQTVFS